MRIKLTVYGETLEVKRGVADETPMNGSSNGSSVKPIMTHNVCNGCLDLVRISAKHQAIICRECLLRVVFPLTVKTFGDLRRYLRERLKKASP